MKKGLSVLFIGMMFICPAVVGQTDKLYVRGERNDKTNFYHSIDDKNPIGNISGQISVDRLTEENSWSKVLIEGWIKYKYVDETSTKEQYILNCEQSILNKPNGFFGMSIADLDKGAVVKRIADKEGAWLKIQKGVWVKSNNLSPVPTKPIELISWEWSNSANSIMITGVVKNNTGLTHHYLKLNIEAKDGNGNTLGNGSGYVGRNVFNPKESASFTLYIDGAKPETNSIQIDYDWTSVETEETSNK